MMKLVASPIFRSCLIIGAWYLCIRQRYIEFNHSQFLDFGYYALVVLAIIISIVSAVVDYWRYKPNNRLGSWATIIVSLTCSGTLSWVNYDLKQQDKTPTVIEASAFHSGFTSISLELRQNGTYKCSNGGFLGDHYYKRGKYTMSDSIIYLDRSNLFDLIKTDRLQVKTILKVKDKRRGLFSLSSKPPKKDTTRETCFFQIDHAGDTISGAIILRVR